MDGKGEWTAALERDEVSVEAAGEKKMCVSVYGDLRDGRLSVSGQFSWKRKLQPPLVPDVVESGL